MQFTQMGVGNIAAQFLGSGGSMVRYLYLSVRLCMCLHSPICIYVYPFTYLSFIYQSIYLSICLCVYLSLCLSMYTSGCGCGMHGRMYENKFLPSHSSVYVCC